MQSRKVDIVTTTVLKPVWLAGYLDNLSEYGHEEHTTIRIICDRKTPASVYEAADQARRGGFDVDCPTLAEQVEYLARIGVSETFIPWNSDNRRNVGFLRSWETAADVIISIDDDNYCPTDSDFIGDHCVVGTLCGDLSGTTRMAGDAGWFNLCSLLIGDTKEEIYPRGYPYVARHAGKQATLADLSSDMKAVPVALNAGLWLSEPDVDAITRIALAPFVNAVSPEAVVMGPQTWSPVNTQNTALVRDALPAYYYVRMGLPLKGMHIDRFGDVLSGFLVQKCAKHLGHAVRVGAPVTDHKRTSHNLFEDLYHELAGIVLVEEFLPWLLELDVSGDDYADVYAEVAEALARQAPRFSGSVWDEGGREFLADTADCMSTWLRALRILSGAS
jgi:hypothetical protein